MPEHQQHWWIPPVFPAEDEKTRIASYVHRLVRQTFPLIIVSVLIRGTDSSIKALILIVLGLMVVVILRMLRFGYVRAAALTYLIPIWVVSNVGFLVTGGVRTAGFGFNIVMIAICWLILDRRYTLFLTIVTMVWALFLVMLDLAGLLPPVPSWVTVTFSGIQQIIFLIACALTVGPATRDLRAALQKARQELLERIQTETALRQSEQNTREFQEKLKTLHDVGIALDSVESVDELCRLAVELGRSRLGFDRIGIWLYEQNNTIVHGTYGTDDNGQSIDERNLYLLASEYGLTLEERAENIDRGQFGVIGPLITGQQQIILVDPDLLASTTGAILGTGWCAQAAMWDGKHPVGHVSVDNLINKRPVIPYQLDLLTLYGTTLGHLYSRKRADQALSKSEHDTRIFQEKLRALHEVSITLDSAETIDELCRKAVELGRSRLGFDRLGLWLYEDNNQVACGTFGTDELGRITDERGIRIPVSEYGRSKTDATGSAGLIDLIAAGKQQLTLHNPVTLPLSSGITVKGWSAQAAMWDGKRPVGHISTDNLINQQPVTPYQMELLSLYSTTLGHLYTRKQAETVIHQLNVELEQRVIDRTAELQAAYNHLQVISRVKDEFVANVSHELRTPITSLKLRQYLIRGHPDQTEQHLQVIAHETERLHRTIEELLQLSRLDQQQTDFVLQPVDINAVVRSYVADRKLLAENEGLTLVFEEKQHLPEVLADKGLLEQSLAILLTNATNYAQPGGHITVKTLVRDSDRQRWVGFSVADNGPGIRPEEQPRLFERFFRGTTARTSGTPGTGLGLAIAKEIVDRHHGQVEVESSGKAGEGTCFTIWLPALLDTEKVV